jgi:hypothetical protein
MSGVSEVAVEEQKPGCPACRRWSADVGSPERSASGSKTLSRCRMAPLYLRAKPSSQRPLTPDEREDITAVLQVTPNGPWGKGLHSNMPISLRELVMELRACLRAGATGVHLHVRDRSGAETLDPSAVNDTCLQVRKTAEELGVQIAIGLMTGAWIVPDVSERIAMIREWECVDARQSTSPNKASRR